VAGALTCTVSASDVLDWKYASPLYVAVIWCAPAELSETVKLAVPFESSATVPKAAMPS
jgi:hypothetical protein